MHGITATGQAIHMSEFICVVLLPCRPDVPFEHLTDADTLLSEFGSSEEDSFLAAAPAQPLLPSLVASSLPQPHQLDTLFADAFPGTGPSIAGPDPHSQDSEQLAFPLPGMTP